MFSRLGTFLLSALVLSAPLASCNEPDGPDPLFVGDGDGDTDADGDSDGDADGDSDGDADGDSDGDADGDTCSGEDYPCGPYGHTVCEVVEDLSFVAANTAAEDLAGGDNILSMSDLFADESIVGVLLFGTAGWCSACAVEAAWLNDVYGDLQDIDGNGHRIEVVAVVFQNDTGEAADLDFARTYGRRYGFEFPTVADTRGDVLYYFDAQSSPGNVMIDATEMRIYNIIQGVDDRGILQTLNSLDGTPPPCN